MMPTLAQLAPVSHSFAGEAVAFIIGGLGAAAIIVSWVRGSRKQKRIVEPDPIRVQGMPEFVTKEFCASSHSLLHQRLDGHDRAIAAIRDEMKHDREMSEQAARVRSAGVYHKIEDLRRELGDKMDALRVEAKKDTEGVHTRINTVIECIGELRGRIS